MTLRAARLRLQSAARLGRGLARINFWVQTNSSAVPGAASDAVDLLQQVNLLLRAASALLDSLNESAGSVQNAWASLIYATKSTANAHGELADAIMLELVGPLEVRVLAVSRRLFKKVDHARFAGVLSRCRCPVQKACWRRKALGSSALRDVRRGCQGSGELFCIVS